MKKMNAVPIYYIISFGQGFFIWMVFLVSSIYRIQVVGLDALQLVLVGTTLEAAAFLFEIPTGIVADLYSRRLSVITGFIVMGVGFIVEGAMPRFGAVLLAQVIWGVGWTFISGALDAWIADEVGAEHAAPLYLRGAQLYQVGHLLALPIAVWLGDFQVNLPMLVGGGLHLLLGAFLLLFMPENGFQPAPPEERETFRAMFGTFRRGVRLAAARPVVLTLLGVSAFVGLASEGYDRLGDAHLLKNFTFPAWGSLSVVGWFGVIGAVSMVLTILATELVKRRLDTNDQRRVARTLQWVSILISGSMLAFAFSDRFPLAVAMIWMAGVLRALSEPLETAWMNQHIDSEVRATVLSMNGQVNALGQIAGGPGVGYIGNLAGLRAALSVSAVLFLVPAFLYQRVLRRRGVPEKVQPAL